MASDGTKGKHLNRGTHACLVSYLDEAFHQVGRCPVCGAAVLDSGYDDDPDKWWHEDPVTHES